MQQLALTAAPPPPGDPNALTLADYARRRNRPLGRLPVAAYLCVPTFR